MRGLRTQLNRIIDEKKINTLFQPIVSLKDGEILGHEALSRITVDCDIKHIGMLFDLSEKYNCVWDLELLCRTKALETVFVKRMPSYNKKLFLNVNPNIMNDEKFHQGLTKEYLDQFGITPEQIIFEITERTAIHDMESFQKTLDHYKGQDYKIAIDDVGAGYSGLNLISDVKPHYIKLDLNLIRNIDSDTVKYALVKSMVLLSQLVNIQLIAEGIETEAELKTLINLGVHYGQGYFIQRPHSEMNILSDTIVKAIQRLNTNHQCISQITIETLAEVMPTIPMNYKVEALSNIFKDNTITSVCVTQHKIPIGIITKTDFFLKLGSRYGFSLNQNKTVSSIMDTKNLTVDWQMPINEVALLAMARHIEDVYDDIVITRDGEYLGMVSIKNLLETSTRVEVNQAINKNPLTGLWGNRIIEEKIIEALESDLSYTIMYIDIDHFKAYNDCFGFEVGDLIIKLIASILMTESSQKHFVGHIGGDDFVLICQSEEASSLAHRIIESFEQRVTTYYHMNELQRGYVLSPDREGHKNQFPLLSLSIAALNTKYSEYQELYCATEKLAQIKKECKSIQGSCYRSVG